MPGFYEEADLDRVRYSVDIAELIGGYITLKRRGPGDFWGSCPFHSEKTASFHVRADRGMFHCFGCGKGGNIFTFVMEMERLGFNEAVRFIAERGGVPLPERQASSSSSGSTERERLFAANSLALRWFSDRLAKTPRSRAAQTALEYLTGRGVNAEIIQRFQIGFAEPEWDGLVNYASRMGTPGDLLAEASLALRRKDGTGFFDRFRARVIFPIISLAGKPVAFGGRRIEGLTPEDDHGKYVNSNETAVYRKGEHLYGLFTARESIREMKQAYLVEGYIDLLALVQAGILNGVASLGTALTELQAKLLGRFAPRVCVVYDGDAAGIAAGVRAADVLTLAGLEVRLAPLPAGEDPDSLLRKSGAEGLKEALSREQSFVQFRLNAELDGESGQAALINAAKGVLETIRSVRDPLQRDLLLKELESLTGFRREAIDSAAGRALSPDRAETVRMATLAIQPEETPERDLLKALLARPARLPEAMEAIPSDSFRNPLLKSLYIALEQAYLSGETINPAALSDRISDVGLKAFIASAATDPLSDQDSSEIAVGDCIRRLLRRNLAGRRLEIQGELQSLRLSGGDSRPLLTELVELDRRLNALR